MLESIQRSKRYVAPLAILAGLLLIPTPTPAELEPAQPDGQIAQLVCNYLERNHLNKPPIDAELSKALYHRFLKDLDPAKVYFLKEDSDEFQKFESKLGDQLRAGKLDFAYLVYNRFLERLEQRQKLIEELVKGAQDYEAKEYLDTDYDSKDYDYASNEKDLRERWRKRIKFDLLMQKITAKSSAEPKDKDKAEAEAKDKILKRYKGSLQRWKQMDDYDRLELYLTDLTMSIDPHSTYMSPTTLEDFEISMRLNLEGIGAVLRSEDGKTTVVEVVAGGAAAKDGRLKAKDRIVAVSKDGDDKFEDVVNMKLQAVVQKIRGKSGSEVQLKVERDGATEPLIIKLKRQKIELVSQAARGEIVSDGKKDEKESYKIGVIDLPSFYHEPGVRANRRSATDDVHNLLDKFLKEKVDAVVLDLRHNGGGSLEEALGVTGLFIKGGPVVQVKGTRGDPESLPTPENGAVYTDGPLVVLTSRFSASASEIVAGALKDYGRALIVGDESTYGKGTVQQVLDVGRLAGGANLGALKLTIRQFYRVNGASTQEEGVKSDVVIPSLTEHLGGLEKDQKPHLPFAKVDAADYKKMDLIRDSVVKRVKEESENRIKGSKDFTKLADDIKLFEERTARKKKPMPLSETELRALLKKEDSEKIDQKIDDVTPKETPSGDNGYKFKKDNYTNKEVLQIVEDFIVEGKKVVASR